MSKIWSIGRTPLRGSGQPKGSLAARVSVAERRSHIRPASYFLYDHNLNIDVAVSKVLSRPKFMKLAETTQRCYVQDLRLFFSYLSTRDLTWRSASNETIEEYEYLRTASPVNLQRIGGARWNREIAAIKKFYKLLPEHENVRVRVHEIEDATAYAHGSSHARSGPTYLSPSRLSQWRDVGLRGFAWDGTLDDSSRIRQSERNVAFVDLLNGTGLRTAEAHYLTVLELPEHAQETRIAQLTLPALIAKGGASGRAFYVDRRLNRSLRLYIDFARRGPIALANKRGIYESLTDKLVIKTSSSEKNPLLGGTSSDGEPFKKRLSRFSHSERARLFLWSEKNGWEPLIVWLSANGLPFTRHSWQGVFADANLRCTKLAPTPAQTIKCRPHMLRHGYALRMLLLAQHSLDRRFGASPDEHRDFETAYGPALDLVRDLLGHSSREVTRKVYLAPLRNLAVQGFLNELSEFNAVNEALEFVSGQMAPVERELSW